MSSQPSSAGHGRKGSLTRAFSKLKRSMIKRTSRAQESAPPEPSVEPTDKVSDTPAPAPATPRFGPEILEIDDQPGQPSTESQSQAPTVPLHRHQSIQTRLTMLGAEFGVNVQQLGLDIFPERPGPRPIRVEKKIRMRVHYTCHNCQARFGASKSCSKCDHRRCRDCPRDPPRKSKEWSQIQPSAPAKVEHQLHLRQSPMRIPASLIQCSSQAPGMPVERVSYVCHECDSPFVAGTAHYCPNCGHQRCSRCPRQPAQSVPPPDDLSRIITLEPQSPEQPQRRRVWKTPRQRVRWSCHECQTTFQQGGRICSACKHTRCDSCTRIPPKSKKLNDPLVGAEAAA